MPIIVTILAVDNVFMMKFSFNVIGNFSIAGMVEPILTRRSQVDHKIVTAVICNAQSYSDGMESPDKT